MNERPKVGSEQGSLNVHLWVSPEGGGRHGGLRPIEVIRRSQRGRLFLTKAAVRYKHEVRLERVYHF